MIPARTAAVHMTTSTDFHHQLGIEDAIPLIARLPREIELGGEGGAAGGLDLDVNVPGPSRVPCGHDGLEAVMPRIISELVPPQPVSAVVIVAVGVGLPEVQQGATYRLAVSCQHRPFDHQLGAADSGLDERSPRGGARLEVRSLRLRRSDGAVDATGRSGPRLRDRQRHAGRPQRDDQKLPTVIVAPPVARIHGTPPHPRCLDRPAPVAGSPKAH